MELAIFSNGKTVGTLVKRKNGSLEFSYDDGWLQNGWSAISQSIPLSNDIYSGDGVNNYFENLLPDNTRIKDQLAARLGAKGTDAFSLLEKLGRDCVGSLMFLPRDENQIKPSDATHINATSVTNSEIEKILLDLKTEPLGIGSDDFRMSIAGAQEKTGLLWHNNEWHRPHGATATTHILKTQLGELPNGIDLSDSVENEYFCMKFCKNMVFETAEVEMIEFGGTKALSVQRFDRAWLAFNGKEQIFRIPQEDMCQALSYPPNLKYEVDGGPSIKSICDLLKGSDNPLAERNRFLQIQFLFWLLGATDGHAKNYSLIHTPRYGFKLAPLYDVLSAEPAVQNGQLSRNKYKLAMSLGDKKHYQIDKIIKRHFQETAKSCGLDVERLTKALVELAKRSEGAIAKTQSTIDEGVNAQLAKQISDGVLLRAKEFLTLD